MRSSSTQAHDLIFPPLQSPNVPWKSQPEWHLQLHKLVSCYLCHLCRCMSLRKEGGVDVLEIINFESRLDSPFSSNVCLGGILRVSSD